MGNLTLNNIQHEEFVLDYLYGGGKGNAARAYANIYSNGEITPSSYSASSKLLAREDIKDYLSIKLEEQKDLAKYRKIHNVEILSGIIDEMANAVAPNDINGNPQSNHLQKQTAIRAIAEQNKMLGLNEEKADLTVNGGMNFVFNYIPPTDDDVKQIEIEMDNIRKKHGDVAEDIDFENIDSNEEF